MLLFSQFWTLLTLHSVDWLKEKKLVPLSQPIKHNFKTDKTRLGCLFPLSWYMLIIYS